MWKLYKNMFQVDIIFKHNLFDCKGFKMFVFNN